MLKVPTTSTAYQLILLVRQPRFIDGVRKHLQRQRNRRVHVCVCLCVAAYQQRLVAILQHIQELLTNIQAIINELREM